MSSLLKTLPVVDETWSCYGRHPATARSTSTPALLVWRLKGGLGASLVASPDADAHARALARLVSEHHLPALPRRVQASDGHVARLLSRFLSRLDIETDVAPGLPPADVDAFATEFVLQDVVAAATPRDASTACRNRLYGALTGLRLDENWLRLPLNLSLVVEGMGPDPFGLLIHADCCPGFTILPIDEQWRATVRPGTTVIRLPQADPFGVEARWPKIQEEGTRPSRTNPFMGPQRRISEAALERLQASVEVVLRVGASGGKIPPSILIRRWVEHPLEVRLRPCDLGVVSMVVPLAGGSQHLRLRERAS